MRGRTVGLFLGIWLVASASIAWPSSQNTEANSAANILLQSTEPTKALLPKSEISSEELSNRIQDYKSDLNWYGLLIAVVGIGFGALTTVSVVFFALRTERSAIAAAKEELRSSKAQIDEHVGTAVAAAERATAASTEIEGHRTRAAETSHEIEETAEKLKEIVEKASATNSAEDEGPKLTEEERAVLGAAASDIANKPLSKLSQDEFDVLLTEAHQREDWDRLRDLAVSLRTFYQDSAAVALALSSEALAYANLGDDARGIALFEQVIRRFGGNSDPNLASKVAQARYNKANALRRLGQIDAAAAEYDTAIAATSADTTGKALPALARALCNRALIHCEEGKLDEAESVFRRGIALTDENEGNAMLEPAIKNRLGLAKLLELKGDLAGAIAVLDELLQRFGRTASEKLTRTIKNARSLRTRLKRQAKASKKERRP